MRAVAAATIVSRVCLPSLGLVRIVATVPTSRYRPYTPKTQRVNLDFEPSRRRLAAREIARLRPIRAPATPAQSCRFLGEASEGAIEAPSDQKSGAATRSAAITMGLG